MKLDLLLLAALVAQSAGATSPIMPVDPTKIQWDCAVVEVTDVNDHLFEEGLGSIYNITDDDAEPLTDEDSASASLDLASRKRHVSFGQVTWSDKYITGVTTHQTHEEKFVVSINIKSGGSQYLVRAYTARKLMKLFTVNSKGVTRLVATADCSGVTDPRNR
ncbi:MAG: hypothetical protein AB7N80_06190 [Bdellovibrionales bacterium]